jgi:prepilin-type N-terminal cleavage/methylation domain-containing protein
MRGKVLKILEPAADLDGNQDLNLSGGSKVKTRIKIKIMKLRTGINGKEVNGERTSVDCQYHAARERAQGRSEKAEGRREKGERRGERPEGLGLRLRATGFTLIEMIGVLAVIAILAALLIPKVFEAINNSRINNAAVSIRTVKTAVADHFGAYGDLNSLGGTNLLSVPLTNYDGTVLMAEGFLDKPFAVKIGTSATIQVVQGGGGTGTANGGYDYNLDGVSGGSTTNSQLVVEAVIYGVAALDAKDLNDRIDGPALGSTSVNTIDSKGRVEYVAPVGSPPTTTVYVYITHR